VHFSVVKTSTESVAAILDALQQLTVSDADDANSGLSPNTPPLADH